MKVTQLYTLYFVIFLSGLSLAENTPENWFDIGIQHYEQEQYDSALYSFTQVLELGKHAPEVYYNLGNSYAKNEELGEAIFYYYKALELDPGYIDAAHNKKILEQKTIDKIETLPVPGIVRVWRSILSYQTPDQWMWWSFGFAVLTVLCILLFRYSSRTFLYVLIFPSVLATLLALLLSFRADANHVKIGILKEYNAHVYAGPSASSETLFMLHEGTKVEVLEVSSGWIKLRLANGLIGYSLEEKYLRL